MQRSFFALPSFVALLARERVAEEVRERRQRLCGRARREHFEDGEGACLVGHHLFDARDHDVEAGVADAERDVPFVFDDRKPPGRRHDRIRPRDRRVPCRTLPRMTPRP